MNKKGFTLIEILTVVGVVALLLLLSLPTFSSFKNSLFLNAIAREIASDLRVVQSRATLVHKTLSFDPANLNLPAGIQIANSKIITFSSSGFPPPGGSGSITLENRFGHSKKVIVSSLGRVRID